MANSPAVQIEITDAFLTSAYTAIDTAFTVTCSDFLNPRTTAETSSASVWTYDASGDALETLSTGITI